MCTPLVSFISVHITPAFLGELSCVPSHLLSPCWAVQNPQLSDLSVYSELDSSAEESRDHVLQSPDSFLLAHCPPAHSLVLPGLLILSPNLHPPCQRVQASKALQKGHGPTPRPLLMRVATEVPDHNMCFSKGAFRSPGVSSPHGHALRKGT